MRNGKNCIDILLIHNQQSTLHTVHHTLQSNTTRCQLLRVDIGRAALSYLRRDGQYADVAVPDLVFFDLTDAATKSISVMKAIRADKSCRSLPMVLLTSEDSKDALVKRVTKRGKDVALSPIHLDSFVKALNTFKPERVMHAVKLLEELGWILVSVPDVPNESILPQASAVAA